MIQAKPDMCQRICVCAVREKQRQFYLTLHNTDVTRRSISSEHLRRPGLCSPRTRYQLHKGAQLRKGGQVRDEKDLCKTLPDASEPWDAGAHCQVGTAPGTAQGYLVAPCHLPAGAGKSRQHGWRHLLTAGQWEGQNWPLQPVPLQVPIHPHCQCLIHSAGSGHLKRRMPASLIIRKSAL